MLHYTAFGDVKKINKKNISRKNINNSKSKIIEGMTNTNSKIIENMSDTTFDTNSLYRPQFDNRYNKCYSNNKELQNFWNSNDTCYQNCPSNAQQRDNGYCKCGLGGDNDTCNPTSQCINNICVPVELLQNVSNDTTATATNEATMVSNQATATSTNEATMVSNQGTATSTNEATMVSNQGTATSTNEATMVSNQATATSTNEATMVSNEATAVATNEATIVSNEATAVATNEASQVQPYSTDLKTLQIDGNLTMTGQMNATSYGNILIGADGKICIGDSCLNKDNIEKLMQLLNN